MPKLYNRNEIAKMLGVSKGTICNHINKQNMCHVKTKNNFRLYTDKQIIDINDSINKQEITKYYPLKTIETFYIYESKMNKL